MKFAASLFLICSLLANIAHAGFYIGAGINNSSYGYEDLDNSTGNTLYAGYMFPNNFFTELAHVSLGDTQADGTNLGFEAGGMAGYVGYFFGDQKDLGFYGKAGIYSFDTDLLVNGQAITTESSSGLAWAFGLLYPFGNGFGFRGELGQFVGVEDFADDESITGFTAALEYRF